MPLRPYDDKYAKLALRFSPKISKRVAKGDLAPMLWALADYLEANDNAKHEQHLLMLASKWVKDIKCAA